MTSALDEVCTHPQEEYVSCKNGETTWRCTNWKCRNERIEYHDTCSGG